MINHFQNLSQVTDEINFFKVLLLFITFMRGRNMAEILPKMRKIPFDQLITFQKRNESNQFEYVTSVNLDKFH